MKIIAHRGARGLELENSLASLEAALQYDVDAIEFDVHLTGDGQLVVMHDTTTRRTASSNVRIREVSLADLRKIQLKNGQQIPTLPEALSLMGGRHVYIDIKAEGCADPLVEILKQHPKVSAGFVSHLPGELTRIRELFPEAETFIYFLKSRYLIARPFMMTRVARDIRATGIGIDKLYLLNPLTYGLAKRRGFKTAVYSVGSTGLARFLLRLSPSPYIITSHPDTINHRTFTTL